MRLRSIELTNVRRFAGQRARLNGIGDGITVLSEPNEFGKSTFFDALHALFFERHNNKNATIKALQPHAGGGPEVVVEVELPDGRFRIAKRWLAKPQAQVMDSAGRLIVQADEAEAWIDRLMGGGLAGPTGLLWVRQGLLGLEPEGSTAEEKRARENGLVARRDLLSSVAGEIDMMTGGRRMDSVLDKVSEALFRLTTSKGRAKSVGEWARAIEEAAALAKEEAILRPQSEKLSSQLARRGEVQRLLSRLSDPAEATARKQAKAEAEAALAEALAHQGELQKAETALRLARLDAERVQQDIAATVTLASRLKQAEEQLRRAEEAAQATRSRADVLLEKERKASEDADAAAARTFGLRERLAQASRAHSAKLARVQATDTKRRLDRASEVQSALDKGRTERARLHVTAKQIEAAEMAQAKLDLARARAETQAITIEARPEGAAQATIEGQRVPAGPQPVLKVTDLVLPGFGALRIDPGPGRSADGLEGVKQAEKALTDLLRELRAGSVAEARSVFNEAQQLDAEIRQAVALLAELAPEGLDPLRSALANALAEAEGASEDAEDHLALQEAVAEAEKEEQAATAAARIAQRLAIEAGEARAATEAGRSAAVRLLEAVQTEAGDASEMEAKVAALRERLPPLMAACTTAEQALQSLHANAPDLATAEARAARARGAVDQAASEEASAREELASLNATISALAEEGIEERLATLADARAEIEARAARYEAEVRALTRLRRALEDARTKARDAYFGPVLRELQPLLSILSPGAQLTINDGSLLPATLTRNGQEEALEILSGGTREQVAVLTRLAFARLFSASGRPVPVILDDALVHSDDDRIVAMFDALHRTAKDQQILVLTCRQRAFSALGGNKGVVVVESH
jgi:DNA repair exonuclease SbcCD ATPase subunit